MSINLWDQIRQMLRQRIDPRTFEAWLTWTRYHSYEDGNLVVFVPNDFTGNWISERYSELIKSIGQSINGEFRGIDFTPDEVLQEEMVVEVQPEAVSGQPNPRNASSPHLNLKYTFEDFIIGPSNRFAHAAAKAVCDTPARAYNPLFIYGAAGLGKTHLMQAIGHDILRHGILKVLYITSASCFSTSATFSIRRRSISETTASSTSCLPLKWR